MKMPLKSKPRLHPKTVKLTVVGDKKVGKTCLLKTYSQGKFPQGEYVSTVFPYLPDEDYVYCKSITYDGGPILLELWDRVYNRLEDDKIRALQYCQTDIFLLCFNVTDMTSFTNVVNIWQPEVQRHCPRTPFILLGMETDLRQFMTSPRSEVITRSIGCDMAERLKAVAYMECSAKDKEGVKEVFATAVQTVMDPPPRLKCKTSCKCDSRLHRLVTLL